MIGDPVDLWQWRLVLLAVALLSVLPAAAIFHRFPILRTDRFFTLRVPAGFAESSHGAVVLRRYRRWNLALAALAAVFVFAGLQGVAVAARVSFVALIAIGPIVWAAGTTAAFASARRQVWPHRVDESSTVRVARMTHETVVPIWMPLLWLTPAAILAAAAWHLAGNWDLIPQSLPGGEKSLVRVFGLIGLHGSLLVTVYAHMAAAVFGARRSAGGARALRSFQAASIGIMTGLSMNTAVDAASVLPPPHGLPKMVALSISLAAIALVLTTLFLEIHRAPHESAEHTDVTPDECWRVGATLYVNPTDPAWAVRARWGWGYTPNLGHPVMKIAVPALLLKNAILALYVIGARLGA